MQAVLKCRQNGTVVGSCFASCATLNQLVEGARHGLQGPELVLDTQLLFDGHTSHVFAAGAIGLLQRQKLVNVRQREPTVLGGFDKADTAHGLIVV